MDKKEQKTVPFLVLLLAGVLLVILFAVVFRSGRVTEFLKSRGPEVIQEIPISDSDKIEDLEKELDSTEVGSPKSDLELLDVDAATL